MKNIEKIPPPKSEEEHRFTSTGIKFWRHKDKLESYANGSGNTIISTHISPEGSCNLKCPYCSVSKRDQHNRIEIDTIKDYVLKLKSRGLKAVILTGGGEPTIYPQFNELVEWINVDQNLSIALITNGTSFKNINQKILDMFSWIRISLNFFKNYKYKINFPNINGTLGCSMVYTNQTLCDFQEISEFTKNFQIKYIRVLPNCLLEQNDLFDQHYKIIDLLNELNDKRFFHQFKIHGSPCSSICHQAFFRPYLSEVDGGTVFPCDSLVLNDSCKHFSEKYSICKAKNILDFMDGKIKMDFDAKKMCNGCVFSDNIKLLDDWKNFGKNKFDEYISPLTHEEFV